jgi:tryptophan-rich sensory protein
LDGHDSLILQLNSLAINIPINPKYYKWSGISVTTFLGISAALLLIFNTRHWYNGLQKPDFAFPIFILAPIHLFCLVLAGFAVTIVMGHISGNPAVKPARRAFSIWLTLHSVWLVVFGGFHFPVLGLGLAVIQWGAAVFCIQKFYNVDPKAGQRATFFFLLTSYWMLVNGGIISMNDFP